MATNVPKGSIVQAGGTTVAPSPNDPICAAYEQAVEDWCKTPVGQGGEFNDHVFNNLNDPALTATRERPIGFIGARRRPAGSAVHVEGLQKLSNQGGYGSRLARRAMGTNSAIWNNLAANATGSSARWQMSGATRRIMGSRFDVKRVLAPDAIRPNGRPIEIKRPTEGASHNGQLSNYAKASPTGTVELVNCAACDLACKDWDSDCEGVTGAVRK